MDYWWSQFTKKAYILKGNIDPFIVPSLNNHGEQEELRKNPFGRSEHVNVQQKCDLLDKKLKEI